MGPPEQAAEIYRSWAEEELSRHGDAVVLRELIGATGHLATSWLFACKAY